MESTFSYTVSFRDSNKLICKLQLSSVILLWLWVVLNEHEEILFNLVSNEG